ncbi:MAG: hypothetical protein LUD81_07855 [Clostridiales bacterium]|nr:hypothetical protein [Clostridiales bacterium]
MGIVEKSIKIQRDFGVLKSEEDETRYRQDELKRIKEETEKEISEKRYEIETKAKEDVFKEYKNDYKKWFEERIKEVLEEVKERIESIITGIREEYVEKCCEGIIASLENVEAEYKNLSDEMEAMGESEMSDKIKEYEDFIEKIGA